MYARRSPRPKNVTQVLRAVHGVFRIARALPVRMTVKRINEIVRDRVNHFRVGSTSHAFGKVRYGLELKVRRFAMRQRKRSGVRIEAVERRNRVRAVGSVLDYRLALGGVTARSTPNRPITLHG
jgi:hypothetical protein